eukprot:1767937-Alexandrium_andersonii.AAC.1
MGTASGMPSRRGATARQEAWMAGGAQRPRTFLPASACGRRGFWPRLRRAATGRLACSWPIA